MVNTYRDTVALTRRQGSYRLSSQKLVAKFYDIGARGYHVDDQQADPTGNANSLPAFMRSVDICRANNIPLDLGIGTYILNGDLNINFDLWIRGNLRGTTIGTTAETNACFNFRAPGSRVIGGGITNVNAISTTPQPVGSSFIKVDSAHGMIFKNILCHGYDCSLDFTSNELGDSEAHKIEHIQNSVYNGIYPRNIIRMKAGATGTISDSVIDQVLCEGLIDWLIELNDVHRITVRGQSFAASNINNFKGFIWIHNNSGAAGAYAYTGQHTVQGYLEDQFGSGPNAIGVLIDADTNLPGRLLANCVIDNFLTSNPSRTLVRFANSGSQPFTNQNNTAYINSPSTYPGWIDIVDNKVYRARVFTPHTSNSLFSSIVNNGIGTAVNWTILSFPAGGAGAQPPDSDLDIGYYTTNAYDHSVWTVDRLGRVICIYQGDRSPFNAATVDGTATNSWVISTGLAFSIDKKQVSLTPASFLGAANYVYVDSVDNTAHTFTMKSDVNPGGSITVNWALRQ